MTDGPRAASEPNRTQANKALMRSYVDDLLNGRRDKFQGYLDCNNYLQHSPLVADNLTGLFAGLAALAKRGLTVKYDKVHTILGEGISYSSWPRGASETAHQRITICIE